MGIQQISTVCEQNYIQALMLNYVYMCICKKNFRTGIYL